MKTWRFFKLKLLHDKNIYFSNLNSTKSSRAYGKNQQIHGGPLNLMTVMLWMLANLKE